MGRKVTLISLSILTLVMFSLSFLTKSWYIYVPTALVVILLFIANEHVIQKRHSILRNYPVWGMLRYVFEAQRDKIRQYFNESNTDEVPFSKEQRSVVYQRSKGDLETVPFGTLHNVYKVGHEYAVHSMYNTGIDKVDNIKFMIGSKHCTQPYESSRMNISDMSWGSLSGAAIRALNKGAKKGGFSHSTGEGGISPHHMKGGDIIFQIGTGYFGAGYTNNDGVRMFGKHMFSINSKLKEVKMVEIKLSQGAKPGHGGMLPAKKNTKEIAEARGVEPHTNVNSPGHHTAFSNEKEMVEFIQTLRELSGGKPVGIKMCVGNYIEVESLIKTFKEMDNYPDYISIDGSEGGTGSAPLEYTNNMGTPLVDGLVMVSKLLKLNGLDNEIKIFASGKVIDGFDILRLLSLGASGVKVARGFMFSLGCIQARECNKDTCPVGIATQNKSLEKGLVVEDKFERVYRYQKRTIEELVDIVKSMGLNDINDIDSNMIYRRLENGSVKSLKEIYE